MVERNYPHPHRFSCITDDAEGIDPRVRVIPLWKDFAAVKNPTTATGPSCYRRLKAFSVEAREFIGPRFVSLDLDCVIVNDVSPLWNRDEEFVIWGSAWPNWWYNGSMWLMTAGARRQVWEKFNPDKSPREAARAGRKGSDQGWIGHVLGPNETKWTTKDGVYSFNGHLKSGKAQLPDDARIVIAHGRYNPWDSYMQNLDWVREHYR